MPHKIKIHPKPCSLMQACKRFWHNYFNTKLMSSRSEFWKWWFIEYLINIIVWIILIVMCANQPSASTPTLSTDIVFAGLIIWNLILIIPNIMLRIRRFKDVGLPTTWISILLVCDYLWFIPPVYIFTFVSRIASIVIECLPSTRKIIQAIHK